MSAITDQQLKQARGFGRFDPVPMVTQNGSQSVRGGPDLQAERAVYGDPKVVTLCRKIGNKWMPTSSCLSCPGLVGLRRTSNKPAQYLPYETDCQWPTMRPLSYIPGPTHPKVAEAAKRTGNQNLIAAFASEKKQAVINCPLSRTQNGRWALMSPPCANCDHFKGLVKAKRSNVLGLQIGRRIGPVMVACGHPKSCTIRGVASGETISSMLGETK